MKRIFSGLLAAVLSFSAVAATLNPIQLLNPAGSTSGQTIISTGPTTAPAWNNVSLSALTGVLPILNGGTGQTTAAAALTALGGLSTTTAASTYLTQANAASTYLTQANATSTYLTQANAATTYGAKASPLSQFAATTSAQLAGVLSDETGTGVAVFGTSPTITTPNLVGVTGGSAAAAGSVGETLSATGTAVSLTSGTPVNCTSKALNAGDYDVWGNAVISTAATTIFQNAFIGINTTSATQPASPNYSFLSGITFSANATYSNIAPQQPINLSSAGTVFLVITPSFTTSTATATCTIYARRRR